MITTNQLKIGMTLELEDGVLFEVRDFQHVKPGKGQAFVRTKLRNLKTSAVIDRTFRAGEKVRLAHLEHRKAEYLYRDAQSYIFMDIQTYEQFSLSGSQVGDSSKYLKENIQVEVLFYDGKPVGIKLPVFVDLKVVETTPGIRGDTVSGGSKPAKLETGVSVQVPLFIEKNDIVRIDTRTGEYVTRVED